MPGLFIYKNVPNDSFHGWIVLTAPKSSITEESIVRVSAEFEPPQRNIKSEMRSFKSNENIRKKEGGSYYVVLANKASSVTL